MFNRIKNGFTLAEVLITLVIIGVVAALTIPTAINKYKDEELKSQFKKAYSTITQALNKTEMNDFYGYAECYYSSRDGGAGYHVNTDCNAFYNALSKNLSVQKICKGNSLSGGCIPAYQSFHTSGTCAGYNETYITRYATSYVLANGQIIIPYGQNASAMFLLDINGHKGPNAYGKDLFGFVIYKDKVPNIFIKTGYCEFPVEGGRTSEEMIKYALAGKK